MADWIIETKGLSREYLSYEKPVGLLNSIQGIWKRKYKSKIALAPIDLQIPKGQIVGLVGANGAGKTTLLKLLSGLIHPSTGDARVIGYRPWERKNDYLKKISILLGQKNQLWWDIPAADSFSLLASIYDLNPFEAAKRVQELAKLLDCTHVLHVQLRRLSLGERMKMEIIGTLLHNPNVLFLDEPTIGLDVVAQATIRKFISEYVRENGQTVILTSHYMDDIAKLADRLLLMSKGKLVYDGTVNGFISKTETLQTLNCKLANPLASDLSIPNGQVIHKGEQNISLQVSAKNLPAAIHIIGLENTITELNVEQVDFENVIHKFFEAESRLL